MWVKKSTFDKPKSYVLAVVVLSFSRTLLGIRKLSFYLGFIEYYWTFLALWLDNWTFIYELIIFKTDYHKLFALPLSDYQF